MEEAFGCLSSLIDKKISKHELTLVGWTIFHVVFYVVLQKNECGVSAVLEQKRILLGLYPVTTDVLTIQIIRHWCRGIFQTWWLLGMTMFCLGGNYFVTQNIPASASIMQWISGKIFINWCWLHLFSLDEVNRPFIDVVSGYSFIVNDPIVRVFFSSWMCWVVHCHEKRAMSPTLSHITRVIKKFAKAYLLVLTYS